MEKTTLKQQIEELKNSGKVLDYNGNIDHKFANFYDWFCRESSLPNKGLTLMKKVKSIVKVLPNLDLEKTYVFFKNNCPCVGHLYDSFSICDLESGDVLYWVGLNIGHESTHDYQKFEINSFVVSENWSQLCARTFTELISQLKDESTSEIKKTSMDSN